MEFFATQNTSNENILTHIWKAPDGTLHGICVDKDVSIEDAYTQMINYVEPIEIPLGLS
jgi:hypothetical protein|tara:strand:+ start:102 stop:278 length:177 start_codon:yes stop_codon:yes gene_type:complete